MGLSPVQARTVTLAIQARSVDLESSLPSNDGHAGTLDDVMAAPEAAMVDTEEQAAARKLLKRLNPVERRIIRLACGFRGRAFENWEIAERTGISPSWVSRIHSAALRKMRDAAGVA